MSVRVPTTTLYTRLQHGLGASLGRVQQLQSQVSSGQRITKLSDDPVGATTGLRLRAQETDWSAYQRAADDANAILGTVDGALQQAITLTARVQQLTISARNGTYGPDERKAIAAEVRQVRDQMVDLANTQYLGRAVFAGHNATAVTVGKDAQGNPVSWGWAANPAATVSRQVSPAVTMDVNIDGTQVFGRVFYELTQFADAVEAGSATDIQRMQGVIDQRFAALTTALGEVGAMQNRIDAATELGRNVLEQVRNQRSQVEDIDLAEAMMQLTAAATGYQATLSAIAKGDLPSLASFLR